MLPVKQVVIESVGAVAAFEFVEIGCVGGTVKDVIANVIGMISGAVVKKRRRGIG
jgi:hypothetical protein